MKGVSMFGKIKFVPQQVINNTSLDPLIVIETPYNRYLISAPFDVKYQLKSIFKVSPHHNVWTEEKFSESIFSGVYNNAIQEYWDIGTSEIFDELSEFFRIKAQKKNNPYKLVGIF